MLLLLFSLLLSSLLLLLLPLFLLLLQLRTHSLHLPFLFCLLQKMFSKIFVAPRKLFCFWKTDFQSRHEALHGDANAFFCLLCGWGKLWQRRFKGGGERGGGKRKARLEGLEVGRRRQGLRSRAVVPDLFCSVALRAIYNNPRGFLQCLSSFQIQLWLVINSEMVLVVIGQNCKMQRFQWIEMREIVICRYCRRDKIRFNSKS